MLKPVLIVVIVVVVTPAPPIGDTATALAKGIGDAMTSMLPGPGGAMCGVMKDASTKGFHGQICRRIFISFARCSPRAASA